MAKKMEKVTMYRMEVNVSSVLSYLKERSSTNPIGMAGYNDTTVSKLALVHAVAIIEHLERKCTELNKKVQIKENAIEENKLRKVELNKITPRCYGEESLFCKEDSTCKKCLFSCDCKNIVDQKLEEEELLNSNVDDTWEEKQKKRFTKSTIRPKCFGDYDICNSDVRTCSDCENYKDCLVATNDANVWGD